MKKGMAVALAAVLAVLWGCAPAAASMEEQPVPLQAMPALEQPARQSMVFLLDSGDDELYTDATQLLADHVSALTGDMLTVELVFSDDPLADFEQGAGDFLFVDSAADKDFCPVFETLTLPLLYRDYEHFTMGVNSARMMAVVAESMEPAGALPLAGFYQTGNYLVSARPRESGNLVLAGPVSGEGEDQAALVAAPVAALPPGSNLAGLLQQFGMSVQGDMGLEERLQPVFTGGVALGEFTYREMLSLQWEGTELTVLGMGHSVHPRYLVADSGRYSQLPDAYRAAVDEAVAYLYPYIYDGVTRQANELTAWLRSQGVTVERGYPALRALAEEYIVERTSADPQGQYVYELLYSMD